MVSIGRLRIGLLDFKNSIGRLGQPPLPDLGREILQPAIGRAAETARPCRSVGFEENDESSKLRDLGRHADVAPAGEVPGVGEVAALLGFHRLDPTILPM